MNVWCRTTIVLVSINCLLSKASTEELLVSDCLVGLSVGMVLSINWCRKTRYNGGGTIPGEGVVLMCFKKLAICQPVNKPGSQLAVSVPP